MDRLVFDHNYFILVGDILEMFRVFHEQCIDHMGCSIYGYVCLSWDGTSHGILHFMYEISRFVHCRVSFYVFGESVDQRATSKATAPTVGSLHGFRQHMYSTSCLPVKLKFFAGAPLSIVIVH